ncbi:MAG: VCBS repeat-containing protein [Verrucomicrobiota bacterium]
MNLPAPTPEHSPHALRRIAWLGILGFIVLGVSLLFFNRPSPQTPAPSGTASTTVVVPAEFKRGEELAKTVCSSCHLYTPPGLLDKVNWAMEVLPAMSEKIGFHNVPYHQLGLEPRVLAAKLIPEAPILKIEEWRAICTYYLGASPLATAEPAQHEAIEVGLKQFEVVQPEFRGLGRTTLIKIDPAAHHIYLGEEGTNSLVILDQRGRRLSRTTLPSPAASLELRPDGMFLTLMGSYSPSDELSGKLVWLPGPRSSDEPREVLTSLPRPVRTVFADLNQDGREDLLVCGFGNLLGQFSWFENRGTNYVEHALLDRPGAIAAEVHDFNRDGLPDIIVMMAQAREGIYIFYNRGQGEFSGPEPVAEYHALWGFSSFELVDFNGDGFMDILATNGDSGDHPGYLPPFKSFHGIRLYLNDGKNQFKEAWFRLMTGSYKAFARDFDGDGDLDIAAISFYPLYRTSPYESFVYLENQGGMNFKAWSFREALSGRWITMDTADLDGDGDLDIVMGSMHDGPSPVPHGLHERWKEVGPTLLILKNRMR